MPVSLRILYRLKKQIESLLSLFSFLGGGKNDKIDGNTFILSAFHCSLAFIFEEIHAANTPPSPRYHYFSLNFVKICNKIVVDIIA